MQASSIISFGPQPVRLDLDGCKNIDLQISLATAELSGGTCTKMRHALSNRKGLLFVSSGHFVHNSGSMDHDHKLIGCSVTES
ncbi:hypothetical protein BaRGS_00016744 [Batillaria attramentaria]|uniref:Uncharacterized protein n=1 Tax=Batillaria attramentaria TaxID=370345 RepID=A0ABD0KY57_9CAEN